ARRGDLRVVQGRGPDPRGEVLRRGMGRGELRRALVALHVLPPGSRRRALPASGRSPVADPPAVAEGVAARSVRGRRGAGGVRHLAGARPDEDGPARPRPKDPPADPVSALPGANLRGARRRDRDPPRLEARRLRGLLEAARGDPRDPREHRPEGRPPRDDRHTETALDTAVDLLVYLTKYQAW